MNRRKEWSPKIFLPDMYISRILAYRPRVSVSALKGQESAAGYRPAFIPSEPSEITAAERGTLMHKVLQKVGLEQKTENEVAEHVQRLAQDGIINSTMAQHVDIKQVAAFLNGELAARARCADRCFFEAPFCLQISAKEAGLAYSEEMVVVQGIIDMCFIEEDKWVIVDYKTDSVDRESASSAAQKHAKQLALYKTALERITNIEVKEGYIYYLAISQAVKSPLISTD